MILDFFFFTGTGAALSDDLCLVLILIFCSPNSHTLRLSHTPGLKRPPPPTGGDGPALNSYSANTFPVCFMICADHAVIRKSAPGISPGRSSRMPDMRCRNQNCR